MASASLLGLVIWSVIMVNLNTWDKSIRVFESWFNQQCKSRQSTNLEHWHSFKLSVARFLMVQVDMFKEVHSLRFSAEFFGDVTTAVVWLARLVGPRTSSTGPWSGSTRTRATRFQVCSSFASAEKHHVLLAAVSACLAIAKRDYWYPCETSFTTSYDDVNSNLMRHAN